MSGSFMNQRWEGAEETVKRLFNPSKCSLEWISLRQGNVLVSIPYSQAAQVISLWQVIMSVYNNKSGRIRVKVTEADPA